MADFENSSYIRRSSYFLQLQQYLAWFPPSNILIVTSEQLSNFPETTMRRIFQFLEVNADFEHEFNLFDTKLHESSHKRRITTAPDSTTAKTLSVITQLLPLRIRFRAERLLYLSFSQPIKRPKISDALRYRIRDYLNDDIEQLKAYAGYDFPE